MKLKKIIKYVLNKAGITNSQMSGTHINNIVLGSPSSGTVNFSYATAGSGTFSASYDNTVDFKITLGGNTASSAIVYMTSSNSHYLVNANLNGEIHVHVLDSVGSDYYSYAVYATTSGITSASGTFSAPTSATISVSI